jgi:hypothetical protein
VRRVTTGTIEAMRRARVALRCVDSLLPEATPRRRRFLASKILSMCWDERAGFRRGMTQWQAQELISPHMQCLEAQKERCPLLVFWEPISRSIRLFYGEKE